jgi:hypothetical protein
MRRLLAKSQSTRRLSVRRRETDAAADRAAHLGRTEAATITPRWFAAIVRISVAGS